MIWRLTEAHLPPFLRQSPCCLSSRSDLVQMACLSARSTLEASIDGAAAATATNVARFGTVNFMMMDGGEEVSDTGTASELIVLTCLGGKAQTARRRGALYSPCQCLKFTHTPIASELPGEPRRCTSFNSPAHRRRSIAEPHAYNAAEEVLLPLNVCL